MTDNQQAAREWLPIESAPKDGRYVLLYTSVGTHTGFFSADRWWITAECAIHKSHRVTHWQPLPAPPRPTQERSDEG